jgi:hypothetical protein
LVVVVGALCAQAFQTVVLWGLFWICFVVLGLSGRSSGCGGAFSMLVVADFRLLVGTLNMVVHNDLLLIDIAGLEKWKTRNSMVQLKNQG